MTRAWLALGSNLAQPLQQIEQALAALDNIPQSQRVATSSFYRTPPYGPANQPDFLNLALSLDTQLTAEKLLDHTQRIELQQGRIRKAERWGARTLDIDILLYGNSVMDTPRLTIPHYDMHNRAFMLVPLAEIAPDLLLPDGRTIAEILTTLDCSQITRW